jgi:plasmid stabilization system protein ParE
LVRTKKENLGVELIEELEYYLHLISENPFYFEVNPEKENLRKVPLVRFPYIIIYWVDENLKTIFIDAVFHSKRKPKNTDTLAKFVKRYRLCLFQYN